MADSRLTDLPNLITPHNNDVLYIVDVNKDSSNKITYANLVSNTIQSLSTYITDINIPAVNGLITDVGTLQVIQLTKADQTSLDATNTNLTNLQSNVTVYANQTTKNANNIVALSGNIDNRATIINLNTTNANVLTLSSTVLTKASQDSVNEKADQVDLNNLSTDVTTISESLSSNTRQTARNTVNVEALSGYIDNKASQTAVTTNTVDIEALSGYIDGKATIASVALKANQTDFANLTGDVVTISDDLSDNISQTNTNTVDIEALSGYIDGKATIASVDLNTSNIEELSATVLTKASQADLELKADQIDLNNLSTDVGIVSSNVSNIVEDLSSTNDALDIVRENVTSNQLNIINNSLLIDTLSTTKADQTLLNELSARVIENEDVLETITFEFPFNISVSTGTSYLTSFYGLISPAGSYPVSNNGTTIVVPNLSSSDGNIGNWNGLLVNTYVLSSEAIQVSIYNPTASTITTTNTNIILTVSDYVN